MSRFADVVKQDTARIVIKCERNGGKEQFQWGMVGKMQLLTVVGFITRTQAELITHDRSEEPCLEMALVIAETGPGVFEWFIHPDMPVDSTIGMLETIKITLLGTQMAQQTANRQLLLGPNGQPMRG